MAGHAGLVEVETQLMRPLDPAEQTLATSLLQLASATLRTKVTNLDQRMDADPGFALQVQYVEASAVKRAIENPAGLTYETIGPFAAQRPASDNPGGLAFSAGELRLLGVGGGAFTITPYMVVPTPTMPPELVGWINAG